MNDWPIRLAPDPTYVRRERARRDPRFLAEALAFATASPGGRVERPLDVGSASEIEGRAASTPCAVCAGVRVVDDHVVRWRGGQPVRFIVAHCKHCGADGSLYFRVRPPLPA